MYDVIVFDGNHLAHRCYYRFKAYNSLVRITYFDKFKFSKNIGNIDNDFLLFSTGMAFGFIRSLVSAKNTYGNNKTKIIICWDSKCEWRKKLLPTYKLGRKRDEQKYEHSFICQYIMLREMLDCIPCNEFQVYDYEADDLVYTFVKKYYNKGKKVLLVSGDMDLFQCLNYCDILRTKSNHPIIYTREDFKNEYKVKVKDWVSVKAMAGDNSDNIKGFRGIGIVKALKIIKERKGIPKEYSDKQNIKMYNDNLKLVTLKYCNEIRYIRKESNIKKLKELFYFLKFKHYLKKDNLKFILKLNN